MMEKDVLTTVQVNHNVQTRGLGPVKRLSQNVISALDEWLTTDWDHAPVSNWNAHVVQTGCSDLVEVVLSNPGIPMRREAIMGLGTTQCLAVGVLVNYAATVGPLFEDAGCYPGLEHEPTAKVHTADFFVVVEFECIITFCWRSVYL